jgi:hypothetical protein
LTTPVTYGSSSATLKGQNPHFFFFFLKKKKNLKF